MVAIRPHDDDHKPIWVVRALIDYNVNRKYPNCIEIQFYKPVSKQNDVQESYVGWDSECSFKWKIDDSLDPHWIHGDCIITSWKT